MLAWDAWRGQLGANPINTAIHITGVTALVFLLLSLAITPLRWLSGWGGWISFRRSLGLYGFFYAIVHVIIYFTWDRELSIASLISELSKRRFLSVGGISLALMVPLAITSTNAMQRKLGQTQWKRLHRLAYPIAILAVVHFVMSVKSDLREPLAFGAVLVLLLAVRPWMSTQTKKQKRPQASQTQPVSG